MDRDPFAQSSLRGARSNVRAAGGVQATLQEVTARVSGLQASLGEKERMLRAGEQQLQARAASPRASPYIYQPGRAVYPAVHAAYPVICGRTTGSSSGPPGLKRDLEIPPETARPFAPASRVTSGSQGGYLHGCFSLAARVCS